MDYNALGLANDISDNHKQSYFNVKDQEVLFSFNISDIILLLAIWTSIIL